MVDGLLGLGHDAVVGSNDNDGNVRYLCTTGTHGGKRFVTGSVEECNVASILQFHVVRTDVLCNTSGFTGNHVGLADVVQQRGLTVVYVTHNRYNRSAGQQVFLVVFNHINGLANLGADIFCLEAELLSDNVNGFGVHTLVDADHDTNAHASGDNLCYRYIHHGGQFVGSNKFCKFQNLAFCCFCLYFLFDSGADGITLFAAILGALAHLVVLVCETSQGFAYLLCYFLITNFRLNRSLLGLVLLALLVLSAIVVGVCMVVVGVVVLLLSATIAIIVLNLVGYGIYVNALFSNACSLLAVSLSLLAVGSVLFLAFTALFLLTLLLGAGALVQSRQVNVTLYGKAGTSLGSGIQTEHTIHLCTDCRFFSLWCSGFCGGCFGFLYSLFLYGFGCCCHSLLLRGFLRGFFLGLLGCIQVNVSQHFGAVNFFHFNLDHLRLLLLLGRA